MQLAVTLQYFPADADPITVHASTNPRLIRAFRQAVLREAQERRMAASSDPMGEAIEAAEEQRLLAVFNALMSKEAA